MAGNILTTSEMLSRGIGIASPVPMGDWTATTQYQKLNIVRSNGASYIAKKTNQGFEPTVTQGWQEVWQLVASDGIPSTSGTYPDFTAGYATNAQNDGAGENIADQFTSIKQEIQNIPTIDIVEGDGIIIKKSADSTNSNVTTYTIYATSAIAIDTFPNAYLVGYNFNGKSVTFTSLNYNGTDINYEIDFANGYKISGYGGGGMDMKIYNPYVGGTEITISQGELPTTYIFRDGSSDIGTNCKITAFKLGFGTTTLQTVTPEVFQANIQIQFNNLT